MKHHQLLNQTLNCLFSPRLSQQPNNNKTQILKPQLFHSTKQQQQQQNPNPNPMEVEVKLRLKDSNSHQKLSNLLSPFHTKTLFQENFFFDTKHSTLSANLAALRIRFYNLNSHSILSLKAKPIIHSGISRIEEQEEPLDIDIARQCVTNPGSVLLLQSEIIKRVKEEFGVKDGEGFLCLGGFRNVRGVYEWKGLKLEVDETIYEFGTCYEIECESVEPERDRKIIEGFLVDNGIQYRYSEISKFGVFRSGKLPE